MYTYTTGPQLKAWLTPKVQMLNQYKPSTPLICQQGACEAVANAGLVRGAAGLPETSGLKAKSSLTN